MSTAIVSSVVKFAHGIKIALIFLGLILNNEMRIYTNFPSKYQDVGFYF